MSHARRVLAFVPFVFASVAALGGCATEMADAPEADDVVETSHQLVGTTSQALAGSCGTSSCAGWSAWTNVGASYCGYQSCYIRTYPEPTVGPGRGQKQTRFRWCTTSNGTACQETETKTVKVGCCFDGDF